MTDSTIQIIASYVAFASIVPFTVSLLVYGIGSPWYASKLGVAFFALLVSIVAVLGHAVVRRFAGDYIGYAWVSLALYSLLFAAAVLIAVVIILERRPPGPTRQ